MDAAYIKNSNSPLLKHHPNRGVFALGTVK